MEMSEKGSVGVQECLSVGEEWVRNVGERAMREDGVEVELIYISLNEPELLAPLVGLERMDGEGGSILDERRGRVKKGTKAILSGAVRLGRTRLIDNLLLGLELN